MAIYFGPGSSRSADLGSSIGSSLAQTLQMLTQNKMQQKQQQQQMQLGETLRQRRAYETAQGLSSMGVPQEAAEKIAFMPQGLQGMFMKQFFGSQAAIPQQQGLAGQMDQGMQQQQVLGEQQGQGIDQLSQLLGQQQQYQPQQQQGLDQLIGPAGQQEAPYTPINEQLQSIVSQGGGQPQEEQQVQPAQEEQPVQQAQAEPDYSAVTKRLQEMVSKLSPEDKVILKSELKEVRRISKLSPERQAQEISIPAGASAEAKPGYRIQAKPTARKTFQELLSTPRPSSADIKRAEDMAFRREKLDVTKQRSIDANTKEYYKKVLDSGKDAHANDMRLARMKELNKNGNLSNPAFASILKTVKHGLWGVGLDLDFLQSADSQEFNKLSTDFLKNAKTIFGSRVTEGEIKMFLQTIPTLTQSKAAKNRVIRNMKMLNEGAKIRKKAMMDVIAMNGGQRPANMEIIIEKKVGPKLDKIAQAFKFSKPGKKEESSGILSSLDSVYKYLNQ